MNTAFLRYDQPSIPSGKNFYFVLHDQLALSAFPPHVQPETTALIFCESLEKGRSLPYHKKKLVFVLSTMRHFAKSCQELGFDVVYLMSRKHYDGQLIEVMSENPSCELSFLEPAEWDSRQRLRTVKAQFPDRVTEYPNPFFLADAREYASKIRNSGYRMEYFYREMRKKTGFLMEGDKPTGGEWNFDKENRNSLPKKITLPAIPHFEPDEITQEVQKLVDQLFPNHWGEAIHFDYGISRENALELLDDFIEHRLPHFGDFEDAMTVRNGILFHSLLSPYLNNGLLGWREVCEKVQEAYEKGSVSINNAEGFIRQVIGWREYVKVYYEAMMPNVRETNALNMTRGLPQEFWSAQTKMNCISTCVSQVKETAYTHHIPRLMVLSNFSNLTLSNPQQLWLWFWMGFIDAYEWVVLPNVLGMSTFADGGVMASKPYVSGANYINKMSDFCGNCSYDRSKRTGENACPMNYLYWNFVDAHREVFDQNGRVSFMTRTFDKFSEEEQNAIRSHAHEFIEQLERGEEIVLPKLMDEQNAKS